MSELIAPKSGNLSESKPRVTEKILRGRPAEAGEIAKKIGTGQNAKNSIVWVTITWSLILGGLITLGLYLRPMYCQTDYPGSLIDDIKATWSIFLPVVTLALGYIFGKGE